MNGILGVPKSDPYDELAHIGDLKLPKVGRLIRVRVMPDPEHGPGIDLREWVTEERWVKLRAAQAKAALTDREIKGPLHPEHYVGPLRKGWRLGAGAAEELAELLARGALEAERLAIE